MFKEIRPEEFLNNKLQHTLNNQWTRYALRTYKAGDKISKLFDEAYKSDKINTFYSDIIAQNKINGVIEISIDPIEYMLMSTNVSGWNSCHKITEGRKLSQGCYSGGIFSYMCDKVSMIAFRHDGKLYDYKIENQKIKAHSKNWRQMIWIKEDFSVLVLSRQYPSYFPEITKTAREILQEQINNYTQDETIWVHTDNEEKIRNYVCNNRIKKYNDETEKLNALHYNDILNGYNCDMSYRKESVLEDDMIAIGSYPACAICGDEILEVHDYTFGRNCYYDVYNNSDDDYDEDEDDEDEDWDDED